MGKAGRPVQKWVQTPSLAKSTYIREQDQPAYTTDDAVESEGEGTPDLSDILRRIANCEYAIALLAAGDDTDTSGQAGDEANVLPSVKPPGRLPGNPTVDSALQGAMRRHRTHQNARG